jgi:hypothetical protein
MLVTTHVPYTAKILQRLKYINFSWDSLPFHQLYNHKYFVKTVKKLTNQYNSAYTRIPYCNLNGTQHLWKTDLKTLYFEHNSLHSNSQQNLEFTFLS